MGAGALLVLVFPGYPVPGHQEGLAKQTDWNSGPSGESTSQHPKPLLAPSLETLTTGLPR